MLTYTLAHKDMLLSPPVRNSLKNESSAKCICDAIAEENLQDLWDENVGILGEFITYYVIKPSKFGETVRNACESHCLRHFIEKFELEI